MAGSYNHCVETETGRLLKARDLCEMLECMSGDVYEAAEEMYGMIWLLADGDPARVEDARQRYAEGLQMSPGTGAVLDREDD